MTPLDVLKKVMEHPEEMSKEEAYTCAEKFLASVPEGHSVGDIYVIGTNIDKLGDSIVWALSHNQLDQTKGETFVAGEDIKRVMI